MTAPSAAPWSVNRRAAKAVVLNARGTDDARFLLDMLGLVDGPQGREVLPDDLRHYDLEFAGSVPVQADPDSSPRAQAASTRPDGMTTPEGLRALPPPKPQARKKAQPTVPAPPVIHDTQAAAGPYVTALRARDLFVDTGYQRPLDKARVARMAAAWNPRMLGVLDVADRGPDQEPRFAIVNGQHRCAAALKATDNSPDLWVPCTVHEGLDQAGEAQLMFELDKGTKPLSSWDKWRSRSAAGDVHVRAVENVALEHGMKVEPTSFGAVGAAEQLVRRGGPALLAQTVAALIPAYGPTPAAVKAPLISGVGAVFHGNGSAVDVPRLVVALRKSSPQQLRAAADAFREVQGGTLAGCLAHAVIGLYNRTPGPRLHSGQGAA